MMEIIAWIVFLYFFTAFCVYSWAVVKSFEILGTWDFKVYKDRIGVCSYPKWLLGWAYKLVGVKA